jgi:RNA polymerase-associated protein
MSVIPHKRSGMTLYSESTDPYSHRVRIVLAEKGVTVDVLNVDKAPKAKDELLQLHPYGTVPLLADRELVIFQSDIIMEYLDERFPHPPLMPVYPIARARARLMIYRLNRDWCAHLDKILLAGAETNTAAVKEAKKALIEGLTSVASAFGEMPFFLSEEFSLVDCCLLPLLWRLPSLGITLPPEAKPILVYAERLFKRDAFVASLTEAECRLPRIERIS